MDRSLARMGLLGHILEFNLAILALVVDFCLGGGSWCCFALFFDTGTRVYNSV